MFEFGSPHFLWLLALPPLLLWRELRAQPARRRFSTLQYSALSLFQTVPRGNAVLKRRALVFLRALALVFAVLALARPRFGTVERDVIQEGVDIFYCLDISGSMRAEDFQPNRLEKAKELLEEFSNRRPFDRQGIVLFSGESFVLCPLTFDGPALRQFLDSVTFDDLGAQGTAIGMGMARALRKLRESQAKSRVIVLITDGENNAGDITPDQAARLAAKMGVKIYTIGIGSRGITTITVDTPFGPRAQRIETSIDEELLKEIADETGGVYKRAETAAQLEQTLREIDRLEKSEIEMKEYRHYDERMAVFCAIALGLLLLEALLAHTRFARLP